MALALTASANAAVTYRSASGTCQDATLYDNYSKSGGPKNKVAGSRERRDRRLPVHHDRGPSSERPDGRHHRLRSPWHHGAAGRDVRKLPVARKDQLPGRHALRELDVAKKRPGEQIGVVTRGQKVGYQYYDANRSTGAYTVIRKGTQQNPTFGYVLRECVNVADGHRKPTGTPPGRASQADATSSRDRRRRAAHSPVRRSTTESWVAWAVTLASAAWLAWVAADAVVQHVTTRPFDLDGTQTKEP